MKAINPKKQVSNQAKYIQDLKLNGHNYDSTWLPYDYIKDGAVLDFTLGTTPNTSWGTTPPDPLAPTSTGDFAAQVAVACSHYAPINNTAHTAPNSSHSDGTQSLASVLSTKVAATETTAGFSSLAQQWKLVPMPKSIARYKGVSGR